MHKSQVEVYTCARGDLKVPGVQSGAGCRDNIDVTLSGRKTQTVHFSRREYASRRTRLHETTTRARSPRPSRHVVARVRPHAAGSGPLDPRGRQIAPVCAAISVFTRISSAKRAITPPRAPCIRAAQPRMCAITVSRTAERKRLIGKKHAGHRRHVHVIIRSAFNTLPPPQPHATATLHT